MAIEITKNGEGKILIKEGNNEMRLQYSHEEDWWGWVRDDEHGYSTIESNLDLLVRAAKESPDKIQSLMEETFNDRLKNTDRNPNDTVNTGDIKNVRKSTGLNDVDLAQIGKSPEANIKVLITALSYKPFYDSFEGGNKHTKDFAEKNQKEDYVTAATILQHEQYGLSEIEQGRLYMNEAQFKKAFPASQQNPEGSDEEVDEDADAEVDIFHLPERYEVNALQRAFGIEKTGVFDVGTQDVVKEHIHNIIEGLEKKSDKGNPILSVNNEEGRKLYEFVKNERENAYYIYEVDKDLNRIIETNDNGEKVLAPKLDLMQPHAALIALMSHAWEDAKEAELKGDPSTSIEDITQRRDPLSDEEILEEQLKETTELLEKLELDQNTELHEEIMLSLNGANFDADSFKASEAFKKLQTEINKKEKSKQDAANESAANFIAIMQGLQLHGQDTATELSTLSGNVAKAESLYGLFHFMASGQGYDPNNYNNIMSSKYYQDAIFSDRGCNLVKNSAMHDLIGIHTLYSKNNTEQKEAILNYFGDRNEATKAEILQYHRIKYDLYAIKVLSENHDEPEAKKEGQSAEEYRTYIDKFIEDRKDVLKNVTLAHEGRYEVNGKPRYFNPYIRDLDLALESFGVPSADAPAVAGNINRLYEKGVHPTGNDVETTLKPDDQKALFAAAFKHISLQDALNSCDEVTKRRGYNVPDHAKGKTSGYDVGPQFMDVGLPLKRRNFVESKFNELQGMSEEALARAFTEMAPQDKESFLGAIFEKQRSELENNPQYSRVFDKYFEDRLTHRALATHRAPGYNERYGAPDRDLLTQMHMRHAFAKGVERMYSKETATFRTNTGEANLTYNKMLAHFDTLENGAALKAKFVNAIKSMENDNAATWYTMFNTRHYNRMRKRFIEQEKTRYELENAPEDKPDGTDGTDNTGDNDGTNKPGQDGPLSIKRIPVPDDNIPGEFAKGGIGLILAGIDNVYNRPKKPGTELALSDKHRMASDPSGIKKPKHIAQIEGFLEHASTANADDAADAMRKAQSLAKKHNIDLDDFKKYAKEAPTKAPIITPADTTKTTPSASKDHAKAASKEVAISKTKLPAVIDLPEIPKPSAAKRFFSAIGTGITNIFKGTSRATKVAGVGIVLGAVIGELEVDAARQRAEKLLKDGSIDQETMDRLETIYDIYAKAISTVDVSIVGGEFALRAYKINTLIEDKNIDPIIAKQIFPDLLIEAFDGKRLTNKQAEQLRTIYTEENQLAIAEKLAKDAGIDTAAFEEKHGMPIGYYLRDEGNYHKMVNELKESSARGARIDKNNPQYIAIQAIRKNIEMTGQAFWLLETDNRAIQKQNASVAQRERRGNISTRYNQNAERMVAQEDQPTPEEQVALLDKTAEFKLAQNSVVGTQTTPGSTPSGPAANDEPTNTMAS